MLPQRMLLSLVFAFLACCVKGQQQEGDRIPRQASKVEIQVRSNEYKCLSDSPVGTCKYDSFIGCFIIVHS